MGYIGQEPAQVAIAASDLADDLITSAKLNYSETCLLYTSPSPRDLSTSRMPSSA